VEIGVSVKPKSRPEVHSEPLDGDLVLYNGIDGQAYLLNKTAAAIWQRCNGQVSTQTLAEGLVQEFGIDETDASSDVAELLERFVEAGLMAVEE
jgi:PqqD family protein of HPr-rel-A system